MFFIRVIACVIGKADESAVKIFHGKVLPQQNICRFVLT